ncbi:hypothetical protein SAMD00019534_119690, partial [Acytostelium subglobosum LB1]|uniref:hypothetical protein n=1 Tax=Acytostelium subglobosum LB1 TaxID=1410327 RepID=UPI000644ADA8
MNINDYKNWSKDELLQWFTEQTKEDVKVQAKILHQQDIKGADLPLTSANLKEVGCTLGQANAVLRVLEQLPLVPAAPAAPIGSQGGQAHIPFARQLKPSVLSEQSDEGITIGSRNTLPRHNTVKKLYDYVSKHHLVLLRAPPFSGKTSITQLLEQFIIDNHGDTYVRRYSFVWSQKSNED